MTCFETDARTIACTFLIWTKMLRVKSGTWNRGNFGHAVPRTPRYHRSSRFKNFASTVELPATLEQKLESLIAARHELEGGSTSVTEASLEDMLQEVQSMAASVGLNRIILADNDGEFQGTPLTGRTAARLSAPVPLGMLSFGAYGPADLAVEVLDSGKLASSGHRVPGVFKGSGYGQERAYVLSTAFKIPGTEVMGVSRAIATYTIGPEPKSPDTPQRMDITFHTMRLEPLLPAGSSEAAAECLEAWKAALLSYNPAMDAETGVLEVKLQSAPPGWQDYLLMGGQFQLVVGNAGGKTLLRRME